MPGEIEEGLNKLCLEFGKWLVNHLWEISWHIVGKRVTLYVRRSFSSESLSLKINRSSIDDVKVS